MLMIVLGAGASYDSIPSYPSKIKSSDERLPLANQLFENRAQFASVLEKYPQCKPIIPYLRYPIEGKSVEQVMQSLQAEAAQDPQRYKQLSAIRYYIQQVIHDCEINWINQVGDITNHITLIDQVRHFRKASETVCIVTFNYDTLLERALRTIDVNIFELSDYIKSDGYKLIKLHGSVNWAHKIHFSGVYFEHNQAISIENLIEHAENICVDPEFYIIKNPPPNPFDQFGVSSIPAIAIPVETKSEFECPAEHINVLQDMIPHVDKILTIGWRAAEKPFLQLLAENMRPSVITLAVAESEASARATTQNMQQAGVRGQSNIWAGGFTDFILTRQADDFLKL